MSEKLKFAEWFVQQGFNIFPIDPESKRPVIKEWQKYSNTPLSDEEKKQFLEMIEEGYNYAIPGGQKGLVILDVENKETLKAWIGESALNELCQKTLCVDTVHGGIHIYIQADEIPEHKFNPVFVREGKGIADLQSFNSYVLGPGSCINHTKCDSEKCPWKGQNHITCYTLYNELREIGKVDLKGFLKFLAEKGKKLGIELSPSAKEWVEGKKENSGSNSEEEDLEKLKKELAKYHRFKGKTIEAVREEVCKEMKKAFNDLKDRTDPESQRWKAIYSVAIPAICEQKTFAEIGIDRSSGDWRVFRALFTHGVTDLDVIDKLLPPDAKVYAPKWNQYAVHTIKKAWKFSKPALKFQREVQGNKNEREIKKIARKVITEAILERYRIRTFYQITGHNQNIVGIFVWDKKKGVYIPFEKGLRKAIRKLAELLEIRSQKTLAKLSKRDVDDIVDEIRDLTLTALPGEPLRIAFKNGTIEWDNDKLKFHTERTPKQYSFYYLPWVVNYEEIQKMKNLSIQDIEELARRLCPKALETFKSWVDDKWILLFQIIGYTLYPAYKFRKAFMLVGEGKNGKSTFINLVKKILGDYAVSISPRELFDPQNRFVVGQLYHKLANAVAESKDYSIDDMDRIKRLTGDDWITADVKYKDPITFKNIAKIIVASNNMPHVRDTSDKAFWHRWIILKFPHQFPDDNTWFERTFTEEEINGIVTTALASIKRAFNQGHFDYEQTEEEVMDIWLSSTDSVYSFVKKYSEEGIITVAPKNGDLWVKKYTLYKLYRNYCIDQGFRGVGIKTFTRKLREYFGISTARKGPKKVRAYVGIALNEPNNGHEEGNVTPVKRFEDCVGIKLGAISYLLSDRKEVSEEELMKVFKGETDVVNKVEECLPILGFKNGNNGVFRKYDSPELYTDFKCTTAWFIERYNAIKGKTLKVKDIDNDLMMCLKKFNKIEVIDNETVHIKED